MKTLNRSIFFIWVALGIPGWADAAVSPTEYERVVQELSRAIAIFQSSVWNEPNPTTYQALRDPLRPLVDRSGNSLSSVGFYQGTELQGIIRSRGFTRVLIDDTLYGVGDTVGPFTVSEIREDGIVVQQGENFEFMALYPESQAGREDHKR